MDDIKKITFLGINISLIGVTDLINCIAKFAQNGTKTYLVNNVNVHAVYLSRKNKTFLTVLNASDVVFCDGFGVKWGARLLGYKLGERMTPPDWIDQLFERCVDCNLSMYFLGDESKVIDAFVGKVRVKFPTLQIKGYHHGFFNTTNEENLGVIDDINRSGADILITGMGMPLQEIWAFKNQGRLDSRVIMGTGALFRWYSGVERRGPHFLTDNGLEWLWRLFVQPRKVWKRYLIELPCFFGVVVKHLVSKKVVRRPRSA